MGHRAVFSFTVAATFLCASLAIVAQPAITTYHNDLGRTGLNSAEVTLTPQNVNTATFGKLFSLPIDGPTNAQPLYVPNITIPGKGVHNVLFVVTEHDSVFAFDADSNLGANATPLWKATLLDAAHGAAPGAIPEPVSDIGNCGDIPVEVGIVSTPVIDTATGTIYLVGKTNENGVPVQRLHALDITTGAEKPNSPVVIQATVSGTGSGSAGSTLAFDPKWSIQRTGLLLLNGYVYLGFGSHCDFNSWHGWLMAYNASTLQQSSAVTMTPNSTGAGIWMSGGAPAGEVVNGVPRFFVSTGNGTFDSNNDYANDIVRIDSPNGVMKVSDHFTPSNQATLNAKDSDVSSGGALFLPDQSTGGHQRLLVLAAKEGRIYLVDRDNMGGYSATANNIVQDKPGALAGYWATPSFWNNNLYFWGCNFQGSPTTETLKMFSFSGALVSNYTIAESSRTSQYPGAVLSISANGTTNGIVWAALTDKFETKGDGVLLAFDASNVANLLWASDQNPTRDGAGTAVKFTVPTIANGKVYATNISSVNVYGLLPTSASAPVFTPPAGSFSAGVNVTLANASPNAVIYYTLDGTTPTTASARYTSAINLTATTTINAIAVVPGLGTSSMASATYTISTGASTTFNLTSFNSGSMLLVGSATGGTQLNLTSGLLSQTGAAYYPVKLPVQTFTTSFLFQLQNPGADGMTFVIQNAGPTAIGDGGGGLGFSGMGLSAAIKFDLFNNVGETPSSTGLYLGGASPTLPSQDLAALGIDLHSGHPMKAALTYDGTTLNMVLTDQVTSQSATFNWTVNLSSVVGGTNAYFGFTGATGGLTTTAVVTNWIYSSGATAPTPDFTLSATAATLQAGQSATAQITVSPLNGFTGAVALSVSGLPTGVTASVSGTTITFNAAANAASSNANITLTGTSGSLTHPTTLALTVVGATPDFLLSAAAVSVQAGQSSNGQITVSPLNGFTGAVALAVSGLPAGVTASVSGTTVTFTAAANAASSNTNVTITGTSGSLSHTTSLALTVVGPTPDFLLSAAAVSMQAGQSANGPVTVSPLNGFTSAVALSVSGLPAGVTATVSGTTIAFTAAANATAGSANVTVTGTSGTLTHSTNLALTITAAPPPPDFSLTAAPSTLSVAAGQAVSTKITVVPVNGFAGAVTLSIAGLPSGVTASLSGTTITLTAAASASATTATVTVSGASGALSHSTPLTLTVTVPQLSASTNVSLNSVFNVSAITNDGSGAPAGGIDQSNNAYSAKLLGTQVSWANINFALGAAGSPNGVSNTTVSLPAGNYSTLDILATGVNGTQSSKTFVVNYTDGTSSTYTQTLTDWGSSSPATGEAKAVTMAYRIGLFGFQNRTATYLSGYRLALNTVKTVKSVTLPATRNVVVLAIHLTGTPPFVVNLASAYNVYAIFDNGTRVANGGMDAQGYAYSGNLTGRQATWSGITFPLPASGTPSAVSAATIALPAGNFSKVLLLGAAVNGNQDNQTFVINYTDGTTSQVNQSLTDWISATAASGETKALSYGYRVTANGGTQNGPWYLNGYALPVNSGKTVSSITLPNNRNVVILGLALVP